MRFGGGSGWRDYVLISCPLPSSIVCRDNVVAFCCWGLPAYVGRKDIPVKSPAETPLTEIAGPGLLVGHRLHVFL